MDFKTLGSKIFVHHSSINLNTNSFLYPLFYNTPVRVHAVFFGPSVNNLIAELPSGLKTNTPYYLKSLNSYESKLYANYNDAENNTNPVEIGYAKSFYISNIDGVGFLDDVIRGAENLEDMYCCPRTFPVFNDNDLPDLCTIVFEGNTVELKLDANNVFNSDWIEGLTMAGVYHHFKVSVLKHDAIYRSISLVVSEAGYESVRDITPPVMALSNNTPGEIHYDEFGVNDTLILEPNAGRGYYRLPATAIINEIGGVGVNGAVSLTLGANGSIYSATVTNPGSGYSGTVYDNDPHPNLYIENLSWVSAWNTQNPITNNFTYLNYDLPMSGTLVQSIYNAQNPLGATVNYSFSGSVKLPQTVRVYIKNAYMKFLENGPAPSPLLPHVRTISNSNINLTGLQTVNGVALKSLNRVLVNGQNSGIANGIYVVRSGAWTRSGDDIAFNSKVQIMEGALNGKKYFKQINQNPITIGSSYINFNNYTLPLVVKKIELGTINIMASYDLNENKYYTDVINLGQVSGRFQVSAIGYPLVNGDKFLDFPGMSNYPSPAIPINGAVSIYLTNDYFLGGYLHTMNSTLFSPVGRVPNTNDPIYNDTIPSSYADAIYLGSHGQVFVDTRFRSIPVGIPANPTGWYNLSGSAAAMLFSQSTRSDKTINTDFHVYSDGGSYITSDNATLPV
jgi:hypothetical protein